MGCAGVVPSRWCLGLAAGETIEGAAVAVVVGATVLFLLRYRFLKARALFGGDDSADPEQRTNCPSCGARVPVEAETCEYCGEPIGR